MKKKTQRTDSPFDLRSLCIIFISIVRIIIIIMIAPSYYRYEHHNHEKNDHDDDDDVQELFGRGTAGKKARSTLLAVKAEQNSARPIDLIFRALSLVLARPLSLVQTANTSSSTICVSFLFITVSNTLSNR
jgi:hypothetical protein